MTRPRGRLSYNRIALLLLVCAVMVGGAVVFNRSQLFSAPHAAEIRGVGQLPELPPLW